MITIYYTLPHARQWWRLLITLKRTSQSIQLGASPSGTQNGGCLPKTMPNSIDELSDASGDGSRSGGIASSDAVIVIIVVDGATVFNIFGVAPGEAEYEIIIKII